jgi:hypothetical protein
MLISHRPTDIHVRILRDSETNLVPTDMRMASGPSRPLFGTTESPPAPFRLKVFHVLVVLTTGALTPAQRHPFEDRAPG